MGVAALFLVGTVAALRFVHSPGWLVVVLVVVRHGAEGALIGGICDFIAVGRVYDEAKANFRDLVHGVSETVVKDFIGVRSMLQNATSLQETLLSAENTRKLGVVLDGSVRQLQKSVVRERLQSLWKVSLHGSVAQWLASLDPRSMLLGADVDADAGFLNAPAAREAIARCIDEIAEHRGLADDMLDALHTVADQTYLTDLGVSADPKVLSGMFQDAWKGVPRERFIDWLADLDLRAELHAGDAGLVRDRAVRKVIAECVRATAQDDDLIERAVTLLRPMIKDLAPPVVGVLGAQFLRPSSIRSAVQKVAVAIEAESSDARVADVLGEFANAYLERWHALPATVRRGAAAKVADTVAPLVLERAAQALAPQIPELHLGTFLRPALTTASLQQGFRQVARRFRTPDPSPTPGVRTAYAGVLRYLGAYLSAWHALPEAVRLRATTAALEQSGPQVLDKLLDVAWEHRLRLVDVDAFAASDLFRQILATVGAQLEQRSEELERSTIELLEGQLGSLGPDAFVAVLRQRTQTSLDWIKVNGTGAGFALGAIAGGLTALVEHL